MRSHTSHRRREQRVTFGIPQQLTASPQRVLRYWPLDLDVHRERLEELRNNPVERWFRYLRTLPARHLASAAASAAAERFWVCLSEELERVSPPNASPTDDGGVLISWTERGHHVEVEFDPTGSYEWFYRHRESDTADEGVVEDDSVSPALVEYVRRVTA